MRVRWAIAILLGAAALAVTIVVVTNGTGDGVRFIQQPITGPVADRAGRAATRFAPGSTVLGVTEDAFDPGQLDVAVRLRNGRLETVAVNNSFQAVGLAPNQEGVGLNGSGS